MKPTTRSLIGAIFVASCLSWGRVAAKAQTNRAASSAPTPPLPVLMLKSPVDSFRALLVMPAAECREQLASRPAQVQQQLVAKIREYRALSPEERELRLKATELRWYLKPLMTLTPTNRVKRLAAMPEDLREMVQVRLEQWDQLSPVVQRLMLTNSHGASYLASGSAATLYPPLPTEKIQRKFQERFEQVFELTSAEKEKVLASLSTVEQRQMEKTLAAFEKLSPGQRVQCVRSFAKFSGMSSTERQEFLKNAERWSQMTPTERQSWRELVSTAPMLPPLPRLTIRRPPPSPPGLNKAPVQPTTNGG
jgi:hypothetical protein